MVTLLHILFSIFLIIGCICIAGRNADVDHPLPYSVPIFFFFISFICMMLGIMISPSSDKPRSESNKTKSEWNQLSDKEKEWYERNYGEGGGGKAMADVLDSMYDK